MLRDDDAFGITAMRQATDGALRVVGVIGSWKRARGPVFPRDNLIGPLDRIRRDEDRGILLWSSML